MIPRNEKFFETYFFPPSTIEFVYKMLILNHSEEIWKFFFLLIYFIEYLINSMCLRKMKVRRFSSVNLLDNHTRGHRINFYKFIALVMQRTFST